MTTAYNEHICLVFPELVTNEVDSFFVLTPLFHPKILSNSIGLTKLFEQKSNLIIPRNPFRSDIRFNTISWNLINMWDKMSSLLISWSQSYKRNIVLKKTKLVLNYLTAHYVMLDHVCNLTSNDVTHTVK